MEIVIDSSLLNSLFVHAIDRALNAYYLVDMIKFRIRLLPVFFLFALIFFLSCSINLLAEAQPSSRTAPRENSKIGLVLAGGGALGFAHVGVLKVLEANRIPVHVVTGTSMGSIVGAAYASGVTLAEMEEVLSTTDWDELFDESSDRRSQPFRLKPGRNREIYGDAKFGLKDGSLVIPSGIVQGQNVLPLLQRLYQGTANPVNFDSLPLPFRAVTADLETGKAVIPSEGDLATIVRASMSVPGFFAPVELNGKYLVDGGIVNNLPVDVALQLGAQKLIVVELYADLKKKEELASPLAASGQIISLLLAQNSELQRKLMRPGDVLLTPDLTGYTATDFVKGKELQALGEKAALAMLDKLRQFAVSEQEYQAYQSARTSAVYSAPQRIEYVRLENSSNYPEHRIYEQLGFKAGDQFNRDEIEAGIKRLHETGLFEDVAYSTVSDAAGQGVVVKIREKEFLKQYVRLGMQLEDDFDGDSNYRLGVDYRYSDFDIHGAYVDLQAEIGESPKLMAELYQPFSNETPYFIAPSARIGQTNLKVRRDGEDIASYQRFAGDLGLALGREVSTIGEARLAYSRGFGELERDIGSPEFPEFSYDSADLRAVLDLDALDKTDFPTEGYAFQLGHASSIEELGASDSFNTLGTRINIPYTIDRDTLAFRADLSNTFEDRPVERSMSVGGFVDLPGYQQNSLLASDLAIARLMYYHRFSEIVTPLFGFRFFAGGSLNFASLRSDVETVPDNRDIWAGSVFLGADTPLLPTYFGLGWAEEGETAVYLAIGRLSMPER